MTDIAANLEAARALINAEIDKQIAMWGASNERADADNGELLQAGIAQLEGLYYKLDSGEWPAWTPEVYPKTWGGYRDYGSNVANLVVAVAFLTNEAARRIGNAESTWRKPRTPEDPKFTSAPYPVNGEQSLGTPEPTGTA